jgi:WD40 repeat protein
VVLWDVESGCELDILKGHEHEVLSVSLSADNRHALSGSKDATVRLWDLADGHEMHRLSGHTSPVFAVAFSPDGRSAASGDEDGFVRLWDLTATKPRMRALPKWHTNRVHSVAFSPDGKTLVSSGSDGRILLRDAADGSKLREWQLPGPVLGIAFASDARHLAAANANGTIYILRLSVSSR